MWLSLVALMSRVIRRGEQGSSVVEYAFLVVLVLLVAFVALQFLGGSVSNSLSSSGSSLFGP
jgi:Flp pilus assembly pilin Flp